MSFLGNLAKAGAVVGAAYAVKKVSDKYKENNPDGVEDNSQKVEAYKEAAVEVGSEFSGNVQKSIPGLKDKINSGIQSLADFAAEKVPSAAEKVQKAVDSAAEFIGTKFPEVGAKVEEAVDKVAEKASEIIEGVPAEETVEEKAESFDEVVSACEENAEAEVVSACEECAEAVSVCEECTETEAVTEPAQEEKTEE